MVRETTGEKISKVEDSGGEKRYTHFKSKGRESNFRYKRKQADGVLDGEFRLSVKKERKAKLCLFSKLLQNMPEGLALVKRIGLNQLWCWGRVADIVTK